MSPGRASPTKHKFEEWISNGPQSFRSFWAWYARGQALQGSVTEGGPRPHHLLMIKLTVKDSNSNTHSQSNSNEHTYHSNGNVCTAASSRKCTTHWGTASSRKQKRLLSVYMMILYFIFVSTHILLSNIRTFISSTWKTRPCIEMSF